ncbi:MFS transporter [Pelagicoccus mobilis]|uniref:MFS transporter n=1 Tax=Pelagicoccus mobilis TaxID=415221 RepID=A0A934VRX3_9BACT|nr:MFS transporter [Pelagicoccus mobilis]MBK1878063.1 MFS transporter [Pelagicoccus mobilis]
MPEAPDSAPASSTAPVSTRSKIIYGLGTGNDMWGNWLYVTFAWTVFNQFLGVPGTLIGTALMLRLGWDAITDPLFGWWSDNTRTRYGRRRPFILVGSILSGLFFPMLFLVGKDWSNTAYFWWMLGSSMVFMTFVSCFNMPYSSLGAELSPDYQERNSIFKFKGSIQKIMEIAMFTAGAFATALIWDNATWADVPQKLAILVSNAFSWLGSMGGALFTFDFAAALSLMATPFGLESGDGGENVNTLLGAQVYGVILGILMICIGFLLFFGLKERYYDKIVSKSQDKIRITETIWEALKCRPFRTQLAMGLSYSLGLSMVGTLGLYATLYYVSQGNLTEGYLWNAGMGLANTVFGFMGPLTWGLLAHRTDKRFTILCIQISGIVVFTATWWLYTPEVQWLQIFASGSIAFTQAAFWMMYGSIGADVIDYDEYENGKRREGAFSACGSYIMKIGMMLGMFISGVTLDLTGFDAELGGDQSDSAIFWIRFLLAAVPIAGLILSFIFVLNFPLTASKMREIRTQLEERRGTV